jgi:uncharacterized protein (TIGR02284 family)
MNYRYTLVTLSELLAVNRAGENGLGACADQAQAESLKRALAGRASRRGAAAAELRDLIGQLGGDPASRARIIGASGRGWINLNVALAVNDDDAIVDECEHGEDHALEVYRNALDDHLPDFVRQVVLRQFEDLMSEHEQIRFLRNDPPQGGMGSDPPQGGNVVAGIGGHPRQ